MSNFTCPGCTAKVRHTHGEVGCPACGLGARPQTEQRPLPDGEPKVETPPGYKGDYLTE